MVKDKQLYPRRDSRRCEKRGHTWAEFGAGTAPAMCHEESPQEFLLCVICDKEWFKKECHAPYAQRPENSADHYCAPGKCEGGHARSTVGTSPERQQQAKPAAPELPPDNKPVRL